MANLTQKEYLVTVWYRYVSHGEQEKDNDVHKVQANTPEEAITKVKGLYGRNQIPFAFYINQQKIEV